MAAALASVSTALPDWPQERAMRNVQGAYTEPPSNCEGRGAGR